MLNFVKLNKAYVVYYMHAYTHSTDTVFKLWTTVSNMEQFYLCENDTVQYVLIYFI